MINIVLVDDERPALRNLEFLLQDYAEVSVVGMYTNPLAAINEIGRQKPQVVFLDINMPQLKGTDAASGIMDMSPDTDIVFVTAFDQYAIEAFDLYALDYILKPVNPDRLHKTMERVMQKQTAALKDVRKLTIKCLGGFQVAWASQGPIKWRAEKTKELFAYLFHNAGRDISKEELLDQLWPDDAPQKAIHQLYNGIYYIRKALANYGIDRKLININRNYNLTLGQVEVDVQRFLDLEKCSTAEAVEELDSIYKGDYLESEYYSWANFERERLSQLYIQYLIRLAQKLVEESQWDKAENLLVKAFNKNPYEERAMELLLKLYIERDNKPKAVKQYKAYEKFLKEELGIVPTKKLKEIVRSIK